MEESTQTGSWKGGGTAAWMDGCTDGRVGGWMDEQMDGRADGWMAEWMAGWMDGCADGWTSRWMAGRMDGCADGWTSRWMDGQMAGWLAGWLAGWMDKWMDGWTSRWMDGWLAGWMGVRAPGTLRGKTCLHQTRRRPQDAPVVDVWPEAVAVEWTVPTALQVDDVVQWAHKGQLEGAAGDGGAWDGQRGGVRA
eukprot:363306-Chlamydomonas_euryale.AAC.8